MDLGKRLLETSRGDELKDNREGNVVTTMATPEGKEGNK